MNKQQEVLELLDHYYMHRDIGLKAYRENLLKADMQMYVVQNYAVDVSKRLRELGFEVPVLMEAAKPSLSAMNYVRGVGDVFEQKVAELYRILKIMSSTEDDTPDE